MTKNSITSSSILRSLRLLLTLLLSITVLSPQVQAQSAYDVAVRIFKREQTLGETGAGLLKNYAKADAALLGRGIMLYASAQADFNGLLEALKAALIKGEDLAGSQYYQDALTAAVKKRVAFTDFVNDKVLPQIPEDSRSVWAVFANPEFLKGAGELLKVLEDAGLEIWREYREVDKEYRQQITGQIESLEWRPYQDVPSLG
jgi:hypothetical protein